MAKKVIYAVDALFPGESAVEHNVIFNTTDPFVIMFMENLSFFEYPNGATNLRARDIRVMDI